MSSREPNVSLDIEPLRSDWRRLLSTNLSTQFANPLSVIRLCRESKTLWTRKIVWRLFAENHSTSFLNERGPVLKVFWSRRWRDGRCAGASEYACASERIRLIERLTNKNRAGRSHKRSNPRASFGSKVGQESIRAICARTRWLNERIATLSWLNEDPIP